MPQCLIIADDLTGANATGVLLHKAGYSAYTVLQLDGAKGIQSECDCLLYPTNSRSRTSEEAYRRVFEATKKLKRLELKKDGLKNYEKNKAYRLKTRRTTIEPVYD